MLKTSDVIERMTLNDARAKAFCFINVMCFFLALFSGFLVDYFFNDIVAIYMTLGISILFIVTMFEGTRTRKFNRSAIIMSVIYNIVFLPYFFYFFKDFSIIFPIFFMFGLVYTAITIDLKYSIILSVIELIIYCILLILFYNRVQYVEATDSLSYRIFYYSLIPIFIIVPLVIGIAIRYRTKFFFKKYVNVLDYRKNVEQSKIAKDMFLTNMSHEIRTPMNAISGNLNLLLEQDINYHVRDNVNFVINAANAFLTVINELMEFSVENIDDNVQENYDLSKLIMEVNNLVSILLLEKRLGFRIIINPSIPRFLNGNLIRVKQVIFNMLHALMNSLDDGLLIVNFDYSVVTGNSIVLKLKIYGTGELNCANELRAYLRKSNLESNLSKEDFISRIKLTEEILSYVNGTMKINEEDNNRFSFNINFIQNSEGKEMLSYIDNASEISCLCYENNKENTDFLRDLFKVLRVDAVFVDNRLDFETNYTNNSFTHVFVASDKYNECSRTINKYKKDEKIVLITSFGESTGISDVDVSIMRPVNSIILYKIFNNEEIYEFGGKIKKKIKSLNNVKVLLVDDNFTNLNVAGAIFKNYGAEVYTASSGSEGVRIINDREIDIIFLDYMMPEMNGIDTLNAIKSIDEGKYSDIPAVALSANVVGGVKEMFSQAGFDAFVPKPIDIFILENTLIDLLPEDKLIY